MILFAKYWSYDYDNKLEKITDRILRAISIVAIVVTIAIMCITVADVILRTVANRTIGGVMEMTQFGMVFVTYFAMPWVTWQFGHIKVDLLTTKLPQKAQHVILVIDKLACLAFTVLMTYQIWQQGTQQMKMHAVGAITRWPVYPFYYVTSVLMGVVAATMFVNLLSLIFVGKEKER